MNRINLVFDKQLTRLAGNPYGYEVYENTSTQNV